MCTHLIRRGSRYYLRRRIPADLIAVYGKREITRALGTADPVEARERCRAEGVKLDAEFNSRRATLSASDAISRASTSARTTVRKRELEDQQRAFEEAQEYYYRHVKDEGFEEEERERFEEDVARHAAILKEANKRATEPAKPKPKGTPMDTLLASWARERQPTARTVRIVTLVVEKFAQHIGSIAVEAITRRHVVDFKDALLASGQSAVNTDKTLTNLGVLLNYAVAQTIIDTNPAKGIKVGERRNAKAARLPFDSAAIKAIFSSPVFAAGERPDGGKGEAAYWLPLLAAYTGARLEELAQLRPEDISEVSYTDPSGVESNAWVIRITDEAEGQELKNSGSRRRVPVHPNLIRLGLLDYAASVHGKSRLFPLLKTDGDGAEGALWGKWFGKYLRGICKVSDRRMVFQSFRHLFKDCLREAGVAEDVSDALSGHTSGSVARRYGGLQFPLAPLVDAIQRLRVPGMPTVRPSRSY